jgi:signal transduction histidine kinase
MDEPPPDLRLHIMEQREWAAHMHDLRSPLTVMLGRVQLARRRLQRGELPTEIDADLEALEAAVARLVAAVERLAQGGQRD